MDIYDYLKLDHEKVNQLFKQFENTKNKERRVQIVTLICQELLVHAKSEEDTFYNVLEHHSKSQGEAFHGEIEHVDIKQQIDVILGSEGTETGWLKQVEKLKKLVVHHVKEEEGTLFKKAKKVLSDTDALRLKEQMHYLKQHYLRKLERALVKE